jgi:hypothetical protein
LPLPILVFFLGRCDKPQRMDEGLMVLLEGLDLRRLVQVIVVNYYRDSRSVWAVPTS